MIKYAAEILGTFGLVFAGAGAAVIDAITGGGVTHVGVALTFGLIVMAMIYAVGDVSGAQMNPAVTVGFFASGRLPARWVVTYIVSQIAGGVLASVTLLALFGNRASLGATLPVGSAWQSLGLEVVVTGILMFVIPCISTGPKEVGRGSRLGTIWEQNCPFRPNSDAIQDQCPISASHYCVATRTAN